jgi:formate transporter
MAFHKPDKMLNIALEAGVSKTKLSLSSILMLGFLLDVRVIGNLPAEWGSLSNLLGGAVFPVGLIYFSSYQQKQKEQFKKAS